ncbi:ankyrin repeat protein [Paraburkholderia fungorum]|jgi:ankyrin repeat protein|uniref:ankyrin repeat domain-containing protein n=1 Tax=Paraburkholderia fungorum TaxID=134537 RepID=UPI000D4885BD|nr:ankyrin repeat domain-containing protein [Paraburkholderia fungorum]PRZ56455.1 ankyrin repeat protein [Paraburkholderia fungorum]
MAHIFVDAHGRELPMGENEPTTLYGERGDAALLENALKPKKPKLLARLWSRPSPSLDAQGPSGATPLTFAAAKGFVSDVETLLRHGANPEARDAWGNTPLAIAARKAYDGDFAALDCVERLAAVSSQETLSEVGGFLSRAAGDSSMDDPASAKRDWAIRRRRVLQELLGPHIKDPQLLHRWQDRWQEEAQVALFQAIMVPKGSQGGIDIDGWLRSMRNIEAAIDAGADPNQRLTPNVAAALPPSYSERLGQSALEMVVKNLIAPPNPDDSIHAESDRRVIVKKLLERGANPKQPTSDGGSLLHSIRFARSPSDAIWTIATLAGAGADINEQQASGLTLLDSIVARGLSYDDDTHFYSPHVARLMDAGAQLNRSAPGAEPTILLAIKPAHPDEEVVQLLLDRGASPNEIAADGLPVLVVATDRNEDDIALRLIASGAEPNPSVAPEKAPLMIAAKRGQPQVVEALLKAGARSDVRTEWGATPLSEAASYGQIAAVDTLMPHCTNDQIAAAAHAAVHAISEWGEESKRLRAVDNLAQRLGREQREPLEVKSKEAMDTLRWPASEQQRVMPFLCASREERAISESIGLGKRTHAAQARSAVAMEAAAPSAQSSPRPAAATHQRVAEPQVEKRRGMRL